MSITICNLQCAIGQPHKGVVLSNKQIFGLFPENHQKITVETISKKTFENNPAEVLKKCIEYSQTVDHPALFFGGDHYASFFTVLSSLAKYGNHFRLIWLDAHGDIHNMQTSPSGNRHGMPVRFLMEHNIPGIPRLKPEQILYIGLRDLQRAEWSYIHRRKIQYIRPADVAKQISKIAQFVRGHKIHISLDVDVLDPSIMPCTGTLAEGGLSIKTLQQIYKTIKTEGYVIAIDIMEYNPTLGNKADKKIAKETMMKLLEWIV